MVIIIFCFNIHLLIFIDAGVYEVTKTDYLRRTYNIYETTTSAPVYRQYYSCYVNTEQYPTYFKYIYSFWDTYHAIVYGVVPFFIILTFNIMIIFKLSRMKHTQIRKASNVSIAQKELDPSKLSRKSFQVTVMLLSVAFVFLIFTSPISIYMSTIHDNIKYVRKSKRELVKGILRYIAYFNNALNFYLYFCLSSEFRREFFEIIFKLKMKELTSCTHSTSMGSRQDLPKDIRQTKPIYRRKLEFKKYNDYSESTDQPFLSSSRYSNDHVELYKKKTRTQKLIHYMPKDRASFISESSARNNFNERPVNTLKPFINDHATVV